MKDYSTRAGRRQSLIFRRYIWLMSLLYDNGGMSFEEISRRWQRSSLNDDGKPLPKRTFHDHIEAISEIFGIVISNDGKGDYLYRIENAADLNMEATSKWLLESFSLGNALADARDISERIIFQDIPSSRRYLKAIIDAIRDHRIIEVEYHSFQKGKVPTMRLCPFFVKLYDNRWYVYARKEDDATMKHYALDRIDALTLLDDIFNFEPSEDDRCRLDNCFGHQIYADIKPQIIRIKAATKAAEYLDTLPLHKTQKAVERSDGYVIYEYFFAPTGEFHAALRKWGSQLKVL